jgi:hypothetical protein
VGESAILLDSDDNVCYTARRQVLCMPIHTSQPPKGVATTQCTKLGGVQYKIEHMGSEVSHNLALIELIFSAFALPKTPFFPYLHPPNPTTRTPHVGRS